MTEKYKKNENYKQNDIYEFITSYRIALESNNKDTIHDAFTDIYNFIEKYVHQTLCESVIMQYLIFLKYF